MHRSVHVVGVFLLSFAILGCGSGIRAPEPVPSETTSLLLYSGPLFGMRRLSFTGIVFLGDRLFVGSERGLFEVIDGKLAKRFNWMPERDVVENPYYDRVNNCMWFEHPGLGRLIRFDGENWSFASLPDENLTRGDALAGFSMFNSRTRLYGFKPRGLWELDKSGGWQRLYIDNLNCAGEKPGKPTKCFLMAGAAGDDLLAVIRRDASTQLSVLLPDKPSSSAYDQVCILRNGICTNVPNPLGHSFFVKQIVSGDSKAYILTHRNELFAVDANGLEQVLSPGNIVKILLTDSQTLLAALENGDIHEFSGEWKRRLKGSISTEGFENFIAEHKGRIAYGVSWREATETADCNIRGQSALWVIEGERCQCIGL